MRRFIAMAAIAVLASCTGMPERQITSRTPYSYVEIPHGPQTDGLTSPKMITAGPLAYPTWALFQKVHGRVTARIFINEKGHVEHVVIEKRDFNSRYVSDENTYKIHTIAEIFDPPTINFLMRSGFEPAQKNGIAQAEWARVIVTFAPWSDLPALNEP